MVFNQGEHAFRIFFVESGEFECIRSRKINPIRSKHNNNSQGRYDLLGPNKYVNNKKLPNMRIRIDFG